MYAIFPHIGLYRVEALRIFSLAFRGGSISIQANILADWLSFPDETILWDCLNDMFELVTSRILKLLVLALGFWSIGKVSQFFDSHKLQ